MNFQSKLFTPCLKLTYFCSSTIYHFSTWSQTSTVATWDGCFYKKSSKLLPIAVLALSKFFLYISCLLIFIFKVENRENKYDHTTQYMLKGLVNIFNASPKSDKTLTLAIHILPMLHSNWLSLNAQHCPEGFPLSWAVISYLHLH